MMALNPVAKVQIVTWDTNQWVSFDNQETIEIKQVYANSRCIGGYVILCGCLKDLLIFCLFRQMVWAASLDNGGIAAGKLSLYIFFICLQLLINVSLTCPLGYLTNSTDEFPQGTGSSGTVYVPPTI